MLRAVVWKASVDNLFDIRLFQKMEWFVISIELLCWRNMIFCRVLNTPYALMIELFVLIVIYVFQLFKRFVKIVTTTTPQCSHVFGRFEATLRLISFVCIFINRVPLTDWVPHAFRWSLNLPLLCPKDSDKLNRSFICCNLFN